VHDLVQLLDHMHRDTNRAPLVGDRASHRLANPPRCVGRKLVALAVVELLDGANQSERAFLNQVEEGEAATEIALGDRDNEAQIGLDHVHLGPHVAALDPLGQGDLLVGAEKRNASDLAQEEAERVE
jgi:hypothetical protein